MKQGKKRRKSAGKRQRLYEKYRPESFDDVLGQDKAVRKIKRMLARGWGGKAWWISGASGVGKTTLARIIARQGPEKPMVKDFDSANEVTADVIRNIQRSLRYHPLFPMVYIINEAHSLNARIIESLLGILEKLDESMVVIFTTTKTGQEKILKDKMDAGPLLSRCIRIELTNQGLAELFAKRCRKIARAENLDGDKPIQKYVKLAKDCNNNFRTMLMEIESGCMLD